MTIGFTGTKGTFSQNEKVSLRRGESYVSTKRPQNLPGRWYFEFTHINGSNYHIMGFKEGNSRNIYFYQFNSLPDASVLIYEKFKAPVLDYKLIGFNKIKATSTIGLGLDLYNGIFYIRAEYQMAVMNLDKTILNPSKISLYFGEASVTTAYDFVDINFGDKDFVYGLMPGFTAWGYEPKKTSCISQKGTSFRLLLVSLFLLI